MNKTLVIVGKMGSGKSTLAKILETKGLNRIVTYTTRPKRVGEIDGVDYHFISEEEFLKLDENGFFAETADYNASFGHVYYGSSVDSYKPGSVIILNPYGVRSIKNMKVPCNIVYLYLDEDLIRMRVSNRGDKEEEISRRLKTDVADFDNFEKECDEVIHITESMSPEFLSEYILTKYFPR